MIMRLFEELGPWNWWILGLILLGLEILVPSTFFLWFAISAVLVGTLAFFVDLSWQVNLALFMGLSLISLLIGRRFMSSQDDSTGDPNLNNRGSRYVGREFLLATPLQQGDGRLSIDDTIWRITGPDLAAGTTVKVIKVEGARLVVEAVAKEAASAD